MNDLGVISLVFLTALLPFIQKNKGLSDKS